MRAFYGLPRVSTFGEISSDSEIQAKLMSLYGTVDNIDSFVGALAEDHLPGSSVGALVDRVIVNQFERLRDGDRFFYATDPFLRSDEVERVIDLGDVSLAQVIRWNSDVHNIRIQDDVFFLGRPGGAGPGATLSIERVDVALAGADKQGTLDQSFVGADVLVGDARAPVGEFSSGNVRISEEVLGLGADWVLA
jgi:hypothetical protein